MFEFGIACLILGSDGIVVLCLLRLGPWLLEFSVLVVLDHRLVGVLLLSGFLAGVCISIGLEFSLSGPHFVFFLLTQSVLDMSWDGSVVGVVHSLGSIADGVPNLFQEAFSLTRTKGSALGQ
jgi:hypothetical protein